MGKHRISMTGRHGLRLGQDEPVAQVGCELEEKERFWSELDEVMESIPTGERVVIGADFNGDVGEGNTGDEEVMGKFGVKERNLEGQMVVDFAKRMDMAVVNTYFQKREEHRVTYKSGGRRTQVDYILYRRGNLKEISDCKVVVGESVARQHRMVVCRMTLMVCKTKRSKREIEKKTKWWKLKKEECCEEFRQKLRQALGGKVVLPDDWETTAEVIRETGRKVLGVSSGRRKEDKETWWWNEEVQDSVQRKRLAKKKWDMDRTEENRQEYKELQCRVKREVSKAKQKAYDELYTRLDTREGEKDLYRLARQRDRDGKDVQQVRVIKDRDGRVLTSEESVQRRRKEYFEELMNEENEREKRVEGVNSVEQKVDKIGKDEVRKALKRMKSGKAVGPDDIPVEVWKCLGEAAVEFLASLFNRVLESERMPEEWRRSVLVPIFKNKGDVQSCSNYRGIKLMSHTMKVWERVVEARLRKVVEICEQQYGFMPRKSTTDAIFALRILMEKYRDGQRELHCVFVDLEKAYDRVPREELWYCMRKSGVAEKYVRVVQDMYERSRTVVRCAVGQTEEFKLEVGLHQGSALSPFLFAIVMDRLSEEVRQESPWTMMFADDIVICSESREQVEENLERWRFALERRGMKVSGSKTEYMCVNEREGSGTVRLQGEEVKKVQEFKYLGSTVQSNGECGKEVKKRVQAGWNGWRKVWGVLCERKISARIKGKVYRTVVRAAMLYGLETVSLRKRQESELEVAELKMLRFSLGVTRLDRIRNEYIRGTAHVGRLGDKVRETRLRWFGHVQRRESEYIGRRMLDMELPGRRQRGRPKRSRISAQCLFGVVSSSELEYRKFLSAITIMLNVSMELHTGMFRLDLIGSENVSLSGLECGQDAEPCSSELCVHGRSPDRRALSPHHHHHLHHLLLLLLLLRVLPPGSTERPACTFSGSSAARAASALPSLPLYAGLFAGLLALVLALVFVTLYRMKHTVAPVPCYAARAHTEAYAETETEITEQETRDAEDQDQPEQETLLSAQLLALQGFVVITLRVSVFVVITLRDHRRECLSSDRSLGSGFVVITLRNSPHLSPPIPTCLHSLLYLFPTLSITLDC
ncbi:hypothetical protein QTP70_010721 [Hemibagrus guttatus]|uniref:ribonuclease H n=1 Tax=Hemibagrus guttatus TaxID=175788 RepID=A0AAE0PVY5_9TELE|nr:hypothetical protein QTP70_010721 [Hemibagrus guttatus]